MSIREMLAANIPPSHRPVLAAGLALALSCVILYMALHGARELYFPWNDDDFVLPRAGLFGENARWTDWFAKPFFLDAPFYRPVASLFYWVQVKLFERHWADYLLVNHFLHAVGIACTVYCSLRCCRSTMTEAALAGLLMAVSPAAIRCDTLFGAAFSHELLLAPLGLAILLQAERGRIVAAAGLVVIANFTKETSLWMGPAAALVVLGGDMPRHARFRAAAFLAATPAFWVVYRIACGMGGTHGLKAGVAFVLPFSSHAPLWMTLDRLAGKLLVLPLGWSELLRYPLDAQLGVGRAVMRAAFVFSLIATVSAWGPLMLLVRRRAEVSPPVRHVMAWSLPGLAFAAAAYGQSRYLYGLLVFVIPLCVVALRLLPRPWRLICAALWLAASLTPVLMEIDPSRGVWMPLADGERQARSTEELFRTVVATPPDVGTILSTSWYDDWPPEAARFLMGMDRHFTTMGTMTPSCSETNRDKISLEVGGGQIHMSMIEPRCTQIGFSEFGTALTDQGDGTRFVKEDGRVELIRTEVMEERPESWFHPLLTPVGPSIPDGAEPDGDRLEARVTLDRPVRFILIDPATARHRVWDFRP